MKTFLSVLILFCFIAFAPTPSVKAQNYVGPIYKSQIPMNEKSGGVEVEHHSVWWGGKFLSWAVRLDVRANDSYSKSSPRVVVSQTTKTYHLIGKK